MRAFSNRRLAEIYTKVSQADGRILEASNDTFDKAFSAKIERFGCWESFREFDFNISSVATSGSTLFIASNMPEPVMTTKSGPAVRCRIYSFDVHTNLLKKFKDLEMEITKMKAVRSVDALLLVCKDNKCRMIDLDTLEVSEGPYFEAGITKIMTRDSKPNIYLLSGNSFYLWRIKNRAISPKLLFQLDFDVVTFDVALCLEYFFFLSKEGELIAYHRKKKSCTKIRITNHFIKHFLIDPSERRIAIFTNKKVYTFYTEDFEKKFAAHLAQSEILPKSAKQVKLKAAKTEFKNLESENVIMSLQPISLNKTFHDEDIAPLNSRTETVPEKPLKIPILSAKTFVEIK
jgi:hypothetical protein